MYIKDLEEASEILPTSSEKLLPHSVWRKVCGYFIFSDNENADVGIVWYE